MEHDLFYVNSYKKVQYQLPKDTGENTSNDSFYSRFNIKAKKW